MAKQVKPKWYPQRNCFRSRKKINGVDRTFLGGSGGLGPDDSSAYARAILEISDKIAIAQRQSSDAIAEVSQRLTNIHNSNLLHDANEQATAQGLQALHAGEAPPSVPLMDELKELREQVKLLEDANADKAAQLLAMGQRFKVESLNLSELQKQYSGIQRKQGEAQGKHASTINEYEKSSRLFCNFLAENKVTTTAQLEQSSAIVADYRDDWLDKIAEGESSKSMARRMLLGSRQFNEWLLSREHISKLPSAITRKWASVGTDEAKPTFLTVKECRSLYKKASPRLKLPILLGLNAGYRSVDLLSLSRDAIQLDKGIILRQRHKTGKAQAHKLWPLTLKYLMAHLIETEGDPFASGYSNISKELTAYMQEHVSQTPDKRTAKSLRSTGATELEKLLKGKDPKTVAQYLAHQDSSVAKHYRESDTQTLFEAIDRLCKVFNLQD